MDVSPAVEAIVAAFEATVARHGWAVTAVHLVEASSPSSAAAPVRRRPPARIVCQTRARWWPPAAPDAASATAIDASKDDAAAAAAAAAAATHTPAVSEWLRRDACAAASGSPPQRTLPTPHPPWQPVSPVARARDLVGGGHIRRGGGDVPSSSSSLSHAGDETPPSLAGGHSSGQQPTAPPPGDRLPPPPPPPHASSTAPLTPRHAADRHHLPRLPPVADLLAGVNGEAAAAAAAAVTGAPRPLTRLSVVGFESSQSGSVAAGWEGRPAAATAAATVTAVPSRAGGTWRSPPSDDAGGAGVVGGGRATSPRVGERETPVPVCTAASGGSGGRPAPPISDWADWPPLAARRWGRLATPAVGNGGERRGMPRPASVSGGGRALIDGEAAPAFPPANGRWGGGHDDGGHGRSNPDAPPDDASRGRDEALDHTEGSDAPTPSRGCADDVDDAADAADATAATDDDDAPVRPTRRPYSLAERALVRSLLVELGWGRFDAIAARLPSRRSILSLRGLANSLRAAHDDVRVAYARRRETARPAQRLPWTDADDEELTAAVVAHGWGRLGRVVGLLRKRRSKNAVITRLSVLKKRDARLRDAHQRFLEPPPP